jgi:hypothetical protein
VEIVIAPFSPACLTISASLAWFFAFKISKLNPLFLNNELNSSESSTLVVPINIGCPFACIFSISAQTWYHLVILLLKT